MKTPTAEDVMAACEVARLYHDVMEGGAQPLPPPSFQDLQRACGIIHVWLDQFDTETEVP